MLFDRQISGPGHRPLSPVSIHNLRTVAPCYEELLALNTGLSYMVAPRRTKVRDLSCSAFLWLGFTTLLCMHEVPTLQYVVAAPLLVLHRRAPCGGCLTGFGLPALISTHMHDIFSTYTHVPGRVSIHNLRTIAPHYGELLALLIYLTRPGPRRVGRARRHLHRSGGGAARKNQVGRPSRCLARLIGRDYLLREDYYSGDIGFDPLRISRRIPRSSIS